MLLKLLVLFACIFFESVSGSCPGQNDTSCGVDANATFTEGRVLIQLNFETALKPKLPYSGCDSILTNITLDKLGPSPICAFIADRLLKVYPDHSATIIDGDSIYFQPESILYQNGTAADIGPVLIKSGSDTSFVPDLVITEDGYSSQCVGDKYFVSADLSENSGYAYFNKFKWMLEDLSGNESGMISEAMTYLSETAENVSEILVTSPVFASNRSVSINVTNLFGEASTKNIELKKQSDPVARIAGRKYVEFSESSEYNFEAELILSQCGMDLKNVTYNWNIQTADGGQSIPAENFTFYDKFLLIRPFSLSAGTRYNVTVSLTYSLSDTSEGSVADTVYVTVKRDLLGAVIESGDREIAATQTLVLQGREASAINRRLYTVNWACKDLATGDECKSNGGTPLEFENSTVLVLPMTQGNFVVGKRYEFKLTVTRNLEVASTSINVKIVSSAVPILSVTPLCRQCSRDNDIFFRGILLANGAVNYAWQVTEKNGNTASLSSSSGSLSNDHVNGSLPYNTIFKVPKNTLKVGYAYEVKLSANSQSHASMVFELRLPSRHGHFQVEPKSGLAFNTTFRLRTYAWIDQKAHKPFHYRFGYMKGAESRYLTVWQSSNVLTRTFLPPGHQEDGNKLTLFVQVRNAIGLIFARQHVVTVENQQAANDGDLYTSYLRMVSEKDVNSMALTLQGLFKTGLTDEVKRTGFESYLNAIKTVPLMPNFSPIVLDTIKVLLNMVNRSESIITMDIKETIASLLLDMTGRKARDNSVGKLNGVEVKAILDIFHGILPIPGHKTASHTNIAKSFMNAAKNLVNSLCYSSLKDNSLNNLENSLIKISSRISDFANDVDVAGMFSVSKDFRRRFIGDTCSGSKYVDCIGICSSVRTYKDAKYFEINESTLVTNIHVGQLIDSKSGRSLAPSAESSDFKFTVPISGSYNKETESVKCVMQDPSTLSWSTEFCNSTVKIGSGSVEVLDCTCRKLYFLAGMKEMSPTTPPPMTSTASSSAAPAPSTLATTMKPTPSPADVITIVLKANCTKHISDHASQQTFTNSLILSLEYQLKIDKSRIKVWSLSCGSIIANITISDPDPSQSSEPSKSDAMNSLQSLLATGLMRVPLNDGSYLGAVAPGVSLKTPPPPTTIITTIPPVPELQTNWMPMMASFALILVLVIGIATFIAWLHGRYYKKKRFTDINCDKIKPKKESPEEPFENMSRKQKAKKFDTIMDESIQNAEVPDIIVAAPVSLKRTRGRSRITPIQENFPSSVAASRSNFSAARDVPRLALDDSSSGSEAETSFTERPKSTVSQKVRTKSALSVKSRGRSAKHSKNHLQPDSRIGDRPTSGHSVVSTTESTQNLVV
ncbi:uncharacterized protein LOC135691053 [Rhopilema esculentum]|uniref:uncharacterized protein LOC135691053 n=1 Tax=Rhopilema esculentum TaxID=499914 RepID=UPI0031DAE93B